MKMMAVLQVKEGFMYTPKLIKYYFVLQHLPYCYILQSKTYKDNQFITNPFNNVQNYIYWNTHKCFLQWAGFPFIFFSNRCHQHCETHCFMIYAILPKLQDLKTTLGASTNNIPTDYLATDHTSHRYEIIPNMEWSSEEGNKSLLFLLLTANLFPPESRVLKLQPPPKQLQRSTVNGWFVPTIPSLPTSIICTGWSSWGV